MPLCVLDPSVPGTLQSAVPTKSIGTYRVLGLKVRTFTPDLNDTPIISVVGFPPTLPDPLRDVVGYVVTNACNGGPDAPYSELLVGLGLQGSEGGGFEGVDIAYTAGGAGRTLHADFQLLICGPVVDDRCAGEPFPTFRPS